MLAKHVLTDEVVSILEKFGVKRSEASLVADVLVKANLRGVDSHGVRLLPIYVERIKHETIKPGSAIEVMKETSSTALLDGKHGFGQVIGVKAMRMAIEKAKKTGIGLVGAKNTNHFGMTAYYTLLAVQHDMIGIAMCNTKPHVVAWGGSKPILGTNPISVAVPCEKELPIVFDIATSVTSWGKITMAKEMGKKIPKGWAVDEEGRGTTEPGEAIRGGLLPFGRYKGYGLALLIDIFSGVLTEAESGPGVISLYEESRSATLGQLCIAIDIDPIGTMNFKKRVDSLIRTIKLSTPAKGVKEILMPGEIEFREERQRFEKGIPIDAETWKDLQDLKKN